jgi:hypothetical protein
MYIFMRNDLILFAYRYHSVRAYIVLNILYVIETFGKKLTFRFESPFDFSLNDNEADQRI